MKKIILLSAFCIFVFYVFADVPTPSYSKIIVYAPIKSTNNVIEGDIPEMVASYLLSITYEYSADIKGVTANAIVDSSKVKAIKTRIVDYPRIKLISAGYVPTVTPTVIP